LAKYLKIEKYLELPLTADPKICRIDLSNKKNITFLYIGTFHLREIEKTIEAFRLFLNIANKKYDNIYFSYSIIGPVQQFKDKNYSSLITKLELDKYIKYEGEIRGENLEKYFINSSIGISFVPCEQYFEHQPPTKTYEYLSWGLPVLATDTHANKQIINNSNGIIHKTDVNSISNAMLDIVDRLLNTFYDKKDLSINNQTWHKLVDSTLSTLL
jgi:glycosyltransferase involved in cell wall biosynthesis